MSASNSDKQFVYGYLRQYTSLHNLFNILPSSLYQLIYAFYPKKYNIYGIGKNNFDEFGLNDKSQAVTKYTKLPLFSSILCHPMDLINSYRTFILRDYNNGLSYFGHIQQSPSFNTHFQHEKQHYNLQNEISQDIKIISQGVMAKISIIASQHTLTIYSHDKNNNQPPLEYHNYIGNIFKHKIQKICCLMNEAVYLTQDGQIFYALYNALSGFPNMTTNTNQKANIPPQHVPVLTHYADPDDEEDLNGEPVFIADIACGSWHTVLLSDKGQIYGYGKNMFGQLGFGEDMNNLCITQPTLHPYLSKTLVFDKIKCGALFSMYITNNGLCFLCGDNDEGQIGNGIKKIDVKVPYLVSKQLNANIVDGDCGNKHSVMLTDDNRIYCCGENAYKQCIPYLDAVSVDIPKELLKADIGIEDHQHIERVIAGVDSTIFIVSP